MAVGHATGTTADDTGVSCKARGAKGIGGWREALAGCGPKGVFEWWK